MAATVKVKGLSELDAAFKKMEPGLQKELRANLKRIAEPIAADARSKAQRYGSRTASGIQAGSRKGAAVVRQRRRKTTGAHPDFGLRLMTSALEPALNENEERVVHEVEQLIDHVADREGF